MREIIHGAFRFLKRGLLVPVLLCFAQLAWAQETVPISPSVVLVLKLVSSTHVKPTTGIVISDGGLVLVSADFALSEGEIIVLDGGTDIVSHGRPARVFGGTVSGKLAVLSVDGLKRPGITLSNGVLDAGSDLHLQAFPPAGDIAKGAQPLLIPVNVLPPEQGLQLSVSLETPLPWVSGAIIDHCGYLAGISLSSGPQSLETGKSPLTLFNNELAVIFQDMQITPATANCERPVKSPVAPVVLADSNDSITDSAETPEQTQGTDNLAAIGTGNPDPVVSDMTESPRQGAVVDPVNHLTADITERPSLWRIVPLWLILAGIIVVAVLIWKGVFFFRLHRTASEHQAATKIARDVQPASQEPVTAPLEPADGDSIIKPRSAPVPDFDIKEMGARPDGCDGVLLVEGLLDAETGFRRFCFVNTEQFNIVIGRGNKDIAIEHAAISRAHVRLESDGELITISDLGSRNGTYIGDVPCLAGEIMYLADDDEIFLGDVKLHVRVLKQEAEWA